MKVFTFLTLLIIWKFSSAQQFDKRTFVVIDSITKETLPSVNVFYPNLMKGTITNDEGKFIIEAEKDTLVLSHMTYQTKKILLFKEVLSDTISLSTKPFELQEVIMYDLKNKVQFVLDNYAKLYLTGRTSMQCTYKERLKINNQIVRLSQASLQWWNRYNFYDFKSKSNIKNNKIKLLSVDYSKRDTIQTVNMGYLTNKDFIKFMYLNFNLSMFIKYAKNISIKSIYDNKTSTKLVFDADIIIRDTLRMKLTNSEIYFDRHTKAITQIDFKASYTLPTIKKGKSYEKKIPYTSKTTKHQVKIIFVESGSNKWVLSSYYFYIIGNVLIQSHRKPNDVENSMFLFVTDVKKGKRIPKKDQIDLENPFFTNFPIQDFSQPKVLLDKEEQRFINE